MARNQQELEAESIGKGDKAKTKAAYYRLQREHAEDSGDQKTTDKIYGKLGKKSHSVDSSAVDKGILGTVATAAAIPEKAAGVGAALGSRAAVNAARRAAPRVAEYAERAAGTVGRKLQSLLPKSGKAANAAGKITKVVKKKAPATAARSSAQKAEGKATGYSIREGKKVEVNPHTAGGKVKAYNVRQGKEEYVHPSSTKGKVQAYNIRRNTSEYVKPKKRK